MSSTMQAWRTDINLTQAELYRTINSFFSDIYNWKDVESGTMTVSNNEVEYTDYKLTDSLSLRVAPSALTPYSGNNSGTAYNLSNKNALVVFKYKKCLVLCLKGSPGPNQTYSIGANIIIDTTNQETGFSIFHNITETSGGICNVADDTMSTPMQVYRPYQYSLSQNINSNFHVAQIVPYISNKPGKFCDSLYGVLISPVMNTFVDFNGGKWLFTNGFALPTGGGLPVEEFVSTPPAPPSS